MAKRKLLAMRSARTHENNLARPWRWRRLVQRLSKSQPHTSKSAALINVDMLAGVPGNGLCRYTRPQFNATDAQNRFMVLRCRPV